MERSGIWQDGSASIVLLPSNVYGEQVFSLAKEWTKTGLLRPAMWLDLDKVVLPENGPPVVPVKVLGLAPDRTMHEIEVDLFNQLAQHELKIVRIVGLRYLNQDPATHKKKNQLVRDVGHYLERSLPLPVNAKGMKEAKTRLLRLNLVVHPTQLSNLEQAEVLEGSWEINLLASPEDRRSPWTADAFVREGDQLTSFALAHVASAAGLWNGLPDGAFDEIASGEGQPGRIVVPRLFVRAVSSDGLARRVSSKVLREFTDATTSTRAGGLSISIPGTRAIPEPQIHEYQDWVINCIFQLDDGRLQYQGIPEKPELKKIRLRETSQLSHFFEFAFNKISQIPKWTWQNLRAKFGKKLTEKFQGDGGFATVGIEVNSGVDARDRAIISRYENLKEQIARVNLMPSRINIEKVTAESTPALWSGLRKLFFGMLDGSELPQQIQTPLYENEKLIFERVSNLVFNPEQTLEIPTSSDALKMKIISISDLTSMKNTQKEIEDWIKKSGSALSTLNDQLFEISSEIEKLNQELTNSEVG